MKCKAAMDGHIQQFLRRLAVEKHYSEHTLRAYAGDLTAFEQFVQARGRHVADAALRDVRAFLASMRRAYNAVQEVVTCPVIHVDCDKEDLRQPGPRKKLLGQIRRVLVM